MLLVMEVGYAIISYKQNMPSDFVASFCPTFVLKVPFRFNFINNNQLDNQHNPCNAKAPSEKTKSNHHSREGNVAIN